jgi:glycosyltransferase involved in cell wall biosynthesis
MLSICIPIYNFDVNPLVSALGKQMNMLGDDIELILIDDASNESFKEKNEVTCSKYDYIKLKENIGRSSIRNLFLKYAQFDYLLFLDCDSLIIDDDFLSKYLEELNNKNESVICGGRVYQTKAPEANKMLRWKYGVKKESQTANIRKQAPNHSFMTNNFVVRKDLLQNIQFDERLKNYGHEDTLFGFELLKKGIFISHINNPVDNGDIEDNEVFLEKTEKGIENLSIILDNMNQDPQFIDMVTLLKVYSKFGSLHLLWLISLIYLLSGRLIKYTLINGPYCLWAFDFYKLGLLTQIRRKK